MLSPNVLADYGHRMAGNDRLADAIRQRGWDAQRFAAEVEVDPKTVERWIATGRTPHLRTRERVAATLGVPMAVLWPEAAAPMGGIGELVGLYGTRTEVAPATIRSLVAGARRHIDVLAYSGLWMWDSVPNFAQMIAAKVGEGVGVRICLGDPDSDAVRRRGDEEGIGESLAARCRMALSYAKPIVDADPKAVRCSGATLYATILRFDDELLVNMHLWGNAACASPVLCFRKDEATGIADNVIGSFERVWDQAQPVVG
jgi:transcriptional regulator with XRE-family HTH domain